jgi:hypothetical protein
MAGVVFDVTQLSASREMVVVVEDEPMEIALDATLAAKTKVRLTVPPERCVVASPSRRGAPLNDFE